MKIKIIYPTELKQFKLQLLFFNFKIIYRDFIDLKHKKTTFHLLKCCFVFILSQNYEFIVSFNLW